MNGASERNCQSFSEGCCGCCLNMRLGKKRLQRILERNTRIARRITRGGKPLTIARLIRWHWLCGGGWDHLLACWLAGPTITLSAWIWKRHFGCCAFAGFLSEDPPRVGCLVHPAVTGNERDWRRWAFPLVPTLRCDRGLLCGLLLQPESPEIASKDWYTVSKIAAETRKRGVSEPIRRTRDGGKT